MLALLLFACTETGAKTVFDCAFPTIDADTAWSGTVVLDCSIQVQARLDLAPGTTLRLAGGSSITVSDGGNIQAPGTSDEPITIEPQGAAWTTLAFFEPQAASVLEHVSLRGGGAADTVYGEAMLLVGDPSFAPGHVEIRDCVMDGAVRTALELRTGQATVEGTAITDSGGPAVVSSVEMVGGLSLDLDIQDADPAIALRSAAVPDGRSVDLPLIGVPWLLQESVRLYGPTVVPAGSTLRLDEGASLLVQSADGLPTAALSMEGTADMPILVEGVGSTAWGSLLFGSTDAKNRMQHVQVFGGGAGETGMVALDANGAGSLEIRDCVLENSAGWGITVDGQTINADVETVNSFAGNALGDVRW